MEPEPDLHTGTDQNVLAPTGSATLLEACKHATIPRPPALTFLYILEMSSLSWVQRAVMAVLYISAMAAWSRPARLVSATSWRQMSWLDWADQLSRLPFCSFCRLVSSLASRSRSRLQHIQSVNCTNSNAAPIPATATNLKMFLKN